jgi:hypothetical protein
LTKLFKQDFAEVSATMVEPKFTLFQRQQKGMLGHAGKLVKAAF